MSFLLDTPANPLSPATHIATLIIHPTAHLNLFYMCNSLADYGTEDRLPDSAIGGIILLSPIKSEKKLLSQFD
ncbi:hypothetical protein BGX31_004394 [Mortierella sp. GBA43]|nr:hypothetical protein BGX31_004394 [Mortierella sp. GBA43]